MHGYTEPTHFFIAGFRETFQPATELIMSFKQRVKPFVPPVLWSAMAKGSKTAKGNSTSKPNAPRQVLETTSNEDFIVSFHRITHPDGTFFVPKYAAHRQAATEIMQGRLYEPKTHELIAGLLKHRPGDMIHAGTFFGDMLPTFARACPGTVFAFEPVMENYILAKLCLQANDLENVVLFNAGLSEDVSVARINTGQDGGTHRGGGSKISDRGQLTGLMAIDHLQQTNISIIQLDVEGHELLALQGAQKTIEANAPIIMIEDNDRSCDAFLEGLGYRHIATIPGLFIWSRPEDADILKTLTEG